MLKRVGGRLKRELQQPATYVAGSSLRLPISDLRLPALVQPGAGFAALNDVLAGDAPEPIQAAVAKDLIHRRLIQHGARAEPDRVAGRR